MKITYSIWQGSLQKGTLTANSIKDIIKIVDEFNSVNPPLKFEYLVHKIEQVAQWSSTQIQITSLSILTTYTLAVQRQRYLHGYSLAVLVWFGQLDNGKSNWLSILLSN